MQLGQTTINTPKDDPTRFDPDWRHRLSMAWVANPSYKWSSEYLPYKHDRAINQQRHFLRLVAEADSARKELVVPKELRYHKLVLRWYKGRELASTKFSLEPLLLTAVNYHTIALDLGGADLDPEIVGLYERLFFNIRDKDCKLHESCCLRTTFALPDGVQANGQTPQERQWRAAAAQYGYGGYVTMRRILNPHGLVELSDLDYMSVEAWRTAQAIMLQRLLVGEVSNEDTISLMGQVINFSKVKQERNGGSDETKELASLMSDMLTMTAPKMVEVTRSVDKDIAQTVEIKNRLLSQKTASGMNTAPILDKSEAELDRIIRTKVKGGNS